MSQELLDEVQAINAIYGDGCLAQSSGQTDVYIVTPPGRSSSLRLQFPQAYPAEPPVVLGTNSTGDHGRRGEAALELELFRQAIGSTYQPGEVCLFDALEELGRLLEETMPAEDPSFDEPPEEEPKERAAVLAPDASQLTIPEPPWVLSDPFVEMKSTFIARCARISSTSEAESFVHHLISTDKKARSATHNITAWRVRGPNNTTFQDCNDDGETAAGGRLLHLMQLMDLWDVMVVVTRWYGGQKLGPRRFALINQAARDAFVKAGLVADEQPKKKGPKKP